ncbi:hypothetical protein [Agromyces albus]|uniref:hypothetical protein n=1 Tax=Agromyces albus TaxID=205332 RepID=UPI002788093F|nr:hypothetical protein [Agromyces albus]MDQ0574565.1 hypothetical protein [Agromyces albus]
MKRIVRLNGERYAALESRLDGLTARFELRNVFNPSDARIAGKTYIAFRAIPAAGGRVRAYLASWSEDGSHELVDLTATAREHGIAFIADPKLVELRGQLYVTFNTGFSPVHDNSIFLQRVTPEIGEPQFCVLRHRQRVEKNWAFYVDQAGHLRAVYGLEPIALLHQTDGELGLGGDLIFEHSSPHIVPQTGHLTIGTQMIVDGNDSGFLIAHTKVHLGRKRAYVGRAISLDLSGTGQPVSKSRVILIDSYAALIPSRQRLNPNLLSATYFSGLRREAGHVIIGYGVSDARAAFARTEEKRLW